MKSRRKGKRKEMIMEKKILLEKGEETRGKKGNDRKGVKEKAKERKVWIRGKGEKKRSNGQE